jgi:hypothetical protein
MSEVHVKGYTRKESISSAERKSICKRAIKARWEKYRSMQDMGFVWDKHNKKWVKCTNSVRVV